MLLYRCQHGQMSNNILEKEIKPHAAKPSSGIKRQSIILSVISLKTIIIVTSQIVALLL